ncbi:hypothetical protein NDA18_006569 [Ustilago nuda]|nr:hypothetical protein NDA18_006569 [Ustilago nuda]
MSPYQTRSKRTAATPPAEVVTTSSRRRRIVLQLHTQEDPATGTDPLVPLDLAQGAKPPAAPVVRSPLEPLFLGMDGDVAVPSPLPSPFLAPVIPSPVGNDYSPTSPMVNLYEVTTRCSPVEMTTPERQAAWEAELARSPTPPPMADEVVDAVLAASRAGTPVFRLEVQPLTPPPRWVGRQMPPPPPPDRHLPSNQEITGWAGGCFALAFTNPFGERTRIPCACMHCYLAGLGHCERNIPAHPGMDYPGDGTPSLQPCGSHQAERAHLTMVDGYGPGMVHSEERTTDLVMTRSWVSAMQAI